MARVKKIVSVPHRAAAWRYSTLWSTGLVRRRHAAPDSTLEKREFANPLKIAFQVVPDLDWLDQILQGRLL
jgi:hypothetical protein